MNTVNSPGLSGVDSQLHSQCPLSLCSLFLVNSLLSQVLWSGNSFPTHAHTASTSGGLWGLLSGDPPPISFPLSFFLGPSANRQVAVEATEELWPASPSGVSRRPHCSLCPSSCRPNGWGSLFFTPFQLRTRQINIVLAWARHLKATRVPAARRHLWQNKGSHGTDQAIRASAPKTTSVHCMCRIGSSKTLSPLPRPPPPSRSKQQISPQLVFSVSFTFPPSVMI